MTRINAGIDPRRLTDEHLRAEHREIQRLVANYRKALQCGSINRIPDTFRLGKGHVLFFLDKWSYIVAKMAFINKEMRKRGFKSYDVIDIGTIQTCEHLKDYQPTEYDKVIVEERIIERLNNSPKPYWHYWGARITAEQAINILKNENY